MIITEDIIGLMSYHEYDENITWADSTIRQYLNGEFYQRFTEEERNQITQTTVINNNSPWVWDTYGGIDTTDKIFLLSLEEVVRYFGDSGQLLDTSFSLFWLDDQYNTNRI